MHLHHDDLAPIADLGTTDRRAMKMIPDGGGSSPANPYSTVPKTQGTKPTKDPAKVDTSTQVKNAAKDGQVTDGKQAKGNESKTIFDKTKNPDAKDKIDDYTKLAKANVDRDANDKSYTYVDHGVTVTGQGDFNDKDRVNRILSERGKSTEDNGVRNKTGNDGKPLDSGAQAKDRVDNPGDTKTTHGNVDEWTAAKKTVQAQLDALKGKSDVQPDDVDKLTSKLSDIDKRIASSGEAERHLKTDVEDRLAYVGSLKLQEQAAKNTKAELEKKDEDVYKAGAAKIYADNKDHLKYTDDPKSLATISDDDFKKYAADPTNQTGTAHDAVTQLQKLRDDRAKDVETWKAADEASKKNDDEIKTQTDTINYYRSALSDSTNQEITNETGAETDDFKVQDGSEGAQYNADQSGQVYHGESIDPAAAGKTPHGDNVVKPGDKPDGSGTADSTGDKPDTPAGNTTGPDSQSVDPKTGVVTDTGKDGTKTVTDPKAGTSVVTKPDGTSTTTRSDGSITEVDPDGTTTHIDVDGRKSVTDKDGNKVNDPAADGSGGTGGTSGTDGSGGSGAPGNTDGTGGTGQKDGAQNPPKATHADVVAKHGGLDSNYHVKQGDTLIGIANTYNKQYGTKLSYEDIYKANKDLIDKTGAQYGAQGPDWIYTSETFVIPGADQAINGELALANQ